MRAVEMDVAGGRSVKAVRIDIQSRIGSRALVAALAFLAAVDRAPVTAAAELIEESQLDDVAKLRAQCRARHRIDVRAGRKRLITRVAGGRDIAGITRRNRSRIGRQNRAGSAELA